MNLKDKLNRVENPCKKFYKFNGQSWKFTFWNKEEWEEKELKFPIQFIILDELYSVTWWDNTSESAVYSNEIHYANEVLHVKSFKWWLITSWLYKDIKNIVWDYGQYTKSVYAYMNGELVNFQIKWSFLSEWINKKVRNDVWICIQWTEKRKNGSIQYLVPTIEKYEYSQEEENWAVEMLNNVLIPYHNEYKKKQNNNIDDDPEFRSLSDSEEFVWSDEYFPDDEKEIEEKKQQIINNQATWKKKS